MAYRSYRETKHPRLLTRLDELFGNARRVASTKGVRTVFRYGFEISPLGYYHQVLFKSNSVFEFRGDTFSYFYHRYHHTYRCERAVEIPIAHKAVIDYSGKKILEVGNVLSHYFPVSHDIVDKYEKGHGIINQDIVDFQSSNDYDLIVSISTMEHVGWDEEPRQPMKILRAFRHLKKLLASDGTLLVTVPLGYNPVLDELLANGDLEFAPSCFLKRVSVDNRWIEVGSEQVKDVEFGEPFPAANALLVGFWENQ